MQKTKIIPITTLIDPLSIMSGIKILNGNPVQSYNRDTEEYNDDRAFIPLLILPWVTVVDPNKIMGSITTLTGVEYYKGAPTEGNRILSNEEYIISDAGAPAYSLKVKINTPVDAPYEIYAILSFTDKRTNTSVKQEVSIPLYTTFFEESNFSVKLNQPKAFTIDPTRTTVDVNGKMPVTIQAQMYSGKEKIADENAKYFWYVLENENYRLMRDDEWFLIKKTDREIIIDAMFFENLTVRVRAAYYSDGESIPSEPDTDSLQATTTASVTLPPTAKPDAEITRGAYVSPNVNQLVSCVCRMIDNQGVIENPERFWFCKWFAQSFKTGSKAFEIGHGFILNTSSKEIGVDNLLGYGIYGEVYELTPYLKAMNENSQILVDNNSEILAFRTIKS